ncbi:MAG TPA: beta-1,6-N-acetylglucosaminyltransferase [Acidimicrobiales bacterium]|nr:beta-1,6-N-acetylglucosaminyltransferase [Acidimicrobiales bacterium]
MSLVYVILAHRSPNQLARLVSVLEHEDDLFLIHVDAKADPAPFVGALEERLGRPANVEMIRPVRCDWAGFGHVQATLQGITRVLDRQSEFSHMVLLTGQDYPIKPRDRIREHLERHRGVSFMSWSAGDRGERPDRRGNERWWWHGGLERLRCRHYLVGRRWIGLPHRYFPFPRPRQLPDGLHPYQGLAYWCLSEQSVRYVADFVSARPEVVAFFKRVLGPDENFFQMALLNSPLRHTLVNEDLRYMSWEGGLHPGVLGVGDFGDLAASPKMFARKFDVTVDAEVLEMIDAKLLGLERSKA